MEESELKQYELCFWLKDDGSGTPPMSLFNSIKDAIQKPGAVIINERQPEKRNLAYPIQKQRFGYWGEIAFTGAAETLVQLKTALKYETAILRQVIVVSPRLKKIRPRKLRSVKPAEANEVLPTETRSPQEIQEQLDTKLKEILEV